MFRKSPTILVAALCAAALPGLSACGQRGDLVLPPGRELARPSAAPTASSPNGAKAGNATPAPSNTLRQP